MEGVTGSNPVRSTKPSGECRGAFLCGNGEDFKTLRPGIGGHIGNKLEWNKEMPAFS